MTVSRSSAVSTGLTALAVLAFGAHVASAQTRAGGEFQVNVVTTGEQKAPSVAVTGTGDFVIAWESVGAIVGRRFDAAGASSGTEFRIDLSTTVAKETPTVTANRRGFVVAWPHPGPHEVRGRRFAPDGQALTGELPFTFPSGNALREPRASSTPQGWFVISASEQAPDRGFNFALLDPFQTTGFITCAMGAGGGADGGAVAALRRNLSWVVATADTVQGIEVVGLPPPCSFGPFTAVTAPGQINPAIDVDDAGASVLVWTTDADGDLTGIRGRRLDTSGNPAGAEFQVNGFTTGAQDRPSVAVTADGNFLVAWESASGDGSGTAIFARRFLADGTPRESDFVVNTYTTGDQQRPIAAVDDNGNFVITWEGGAGQDGDGAGAFAQRLGGIRPRALVVDPAGNRMLEPGETVAVVPTWQNVNGLAQAFTGAATAFTGPGTAPNPTYVLDDAAAGYGNVANGASANCATTGNCFAVTVLTSGPRPALHWDARLREEILPATLGQSEDWALHVGDSFTDVPRGSAFYPFVETLLHSGVTGGCGATTYCPTASVTRGEMPTFVLMSREGADYPSLNLIPRPCVTSPFSDVPASSPFCRWIQELVTRGVVAGCGGGRYCPDDPVRRDAMAVFVLATLEGAGYAPPACTTAPFADVPPSSPFCRWIQELARRGVVTGCGGGNYCPAAPVTREQMAVFLTVAFRLQLYGP